MRWVVLAGLALISCAPQPAVRPILTDLQAVPTRPYRPPGVRSPAAPMPAAEPFRPRRYFGPFQEGSDLSQIKLFLPARNSQARLGWYYNGFFDSFDAAAGDSINVYRIYYRQSFTAPLSSAVLPRDATPAPAHTPGGGLSRLAPNEPAAANNVTLALHRVACSSRYGGSLLLELRYASENGQREDFELEFLHGGYGFDVQDLRLNLYVNLQPFLFNPVANVPFTAARISPEFIAEGVTAYRNGRPVPLEEARPVLESIFAAIGPAVAEAARPGYSRDAALFAHAFLHNQFVRDIAGTDAVERVLLSDNSCDVHTRERTPHYTVMWRVSDIRANDGYNLTGGNDYGEFKVAVQAVHQYDNGAIVYMPPKQYELDSFEHSPWYMAGTFTVDECPALRPLQLFVNVTERDFLGEDRYKPIRIALLPDCNLLTVRSTQPNFSSGYIEGAITPFTIENLEIGDRREGWMVWEAEVHLSYR